MGNSMGNSMGTTMADPRPIDPLSGLDLAALRREAGLTQTELASAAGTTRYTVSRWEQKAVIDLKQETPGACSRC